MKSIAIKTVNNLGPTDPLGEALHLLRLSTTFYCRSELSAPWSIELPAFEDGMMFHIVTRGNLWLEVEGEKPRLLQQGSLTLIPHGLGHIIRSDTADKPVALFDIPVEKVSDRYEIMRHGGGGEPTHLPAVLYALIMLQDKNSFRYCPGYCTLIV